MSDVSEMLALEGDALADLQIEVQGEPARQARATVAPLMPGLLPESGEADQFAMDVMELAGGNDDRVAQVLSLLEAEAARQVMDARRFEVLLSLFQRMRP